MDLMNQVFHNSLDWLVVMFIEDVLVYSTSREEQKDHLWAMLKMLWEKKFGVNFGWRKYHSLGV